MYVNQMSERATIIMWPHNPIGKPGHSETWGSEESSILFIILLQFLLVFLS